MKIKRYNIAIKYQIVLNILPNNLVYIYIYNDKQKMFFL